jgi:hypothetical protein
MSYQQPSGRPRGFDRPKKTKAKKSKTRRSSGLHREEHGTQSLREVVDRALSGLDTLGAQIFAVSPFHQHFNRWLKSLESVLDDFEASPTVEVDDKFREEHGGLFSAVEAALKAEQAKEASREATILSLHGSKDILLHAERGHEAKLREHAAHRDESLKSLTGRLEALHAELEEVLESKVGIFEGITKNKAKREQYARARLAEVEKEHGAVKASFAEELTSLQGEYAQLRREILEKVAAEKREIEALGAEAEIDGSVEVRRVACEELAEAVRDLMKRSEARGPENKSG